MKNLDKILSNLVTFEENLLLLKYLTNFRNTSYVTLKIFLYVFLLKFLSNTERNFGVITENWEKCQSKYPRDISEQF